MTQLAYNARGDLCPMQGVIGGITAQEVMKVWPYVLPKHGKDFVCACSHEGMFHCISYDDTVIQHPPSWFRAVIGL